MIASKVLRSKTSAGSGRAPITGVLDGTVFAYGAPACPRCGLNTFYTEFG